MMFSYLDSLVFEARKHPHLPYEKLPQLADTDRSKYLKETSFPKLDSFGRAGKRRHIFFGLLHYFREYFQDVRFHGSNIRNTLGNDCLIMSVALVVQVFASFASPVAINYLLTYVWHGFRLELWSNPLIKTRYIENKGKDAIVRPWYICLAS